MGDVDFMFLSEFKTSSENNVFRNKIAVELTGNENENWVLNLRADYSIDVPIA